MAFRNQTSTKKALEKIAETERKENAKQPLKKNEKSSDEQKQMLNNGFFDWVKEIEENKLLYFALTYQQRTLIITAPAENTEQKKFLGYETSERCGSEGLKESEGLLTNIANRNDDKKLAWFVKQAYAGKMCQNSELEKYIKYIRTADMMDYSRPKFDLQLKPGEVKKMEYVSKYPLVKLGEYVETLGGLWIGKKPPFQKVAVIRNTNFTMRGTLDLSDVAILDVEKNAYTKRKLQDGDIIIEKSGGSNTQAVGRVVLFNKIPGDYAYSNFTARIRVVNDSMHPKYLHAVLNNVYQCGGTFQYQSGTSGLKNLDLNEYLTMKIPFPPLDIQQQIVSECEQVDDEYNHSLASIKEHKRKIAEVMSNVKGEKKKLREIAPYVNTRIIYSNTNAENYITTDNLLQNCEGMKTYDGIPNVDSVISYQKGDILVSNIRPYLKKIWLADRNGGCSPDVLVFRATNGVDSRYLYYSMKQDKFFAFMMQGTKGMKMPRGDRNTIPDFDIVIPQNQQAIISEIETYEQKISEAKAVMEGCAERKKQILEKWLK